MIGELMRTQDYISIHALRIQCIIGIFDWERKQKQEVSIDLKFPCDNRKAARTDRIEDAVDYKKIAKTTIAFVESSQFLLVETLAERLAENLIVQFSLPEIDLTVSKPGALRGSRNVGVQIHRYGKDTTVENWMAVGLGSNIQPRMNLTRAMEDLDHRFGLLGCSHVYETSPVGFSRQNSFWNLAAVFRDPGGATSSLRNQFRMIENKTGRKKISNRNGPRTLDLDILLRGHRVELKNKKKLPHPDLVKKAFALYPLLEILPTGTHPVTGLSFMEMAADFGEKNQKIRRLSPETLSPFTPRVFTR
jgi:dihydroneopterin aldolase